MLRQEDHSLPQLTARSKSPGAFTHRACRDFGSILAKLGDPPFRRMPVGDVSAVHGRNSCRSAWRSSLSGCGSSGACGAPPGTLIAPFGSMRNGTRAFTSSLMIAEVFGRRGLDFVACASI